MNRRQYLASSFLAAATFLPGLACAASGTIQPQPGSLQAELQGVVSLRDLASRATNISSTVPQGAIEMPRHLMPNGALHRTPAALPVLDGIRVVPVHAQSAEPAAKISGFTGIYDGSNLKATGGELEPPDQGLAVNNGQIIEIVNNSVQVFDTSGKALSKTLNNATFFGTSGSDGLSDPHVVFDATAQRWIAEELVYNNSFTGFVLAVSKTADPLGSFFQYRIDAQTSKISGCGASLCFPDYPQVGYDQNAFFIGSDLFSNSSGNFLATGLYALDKKALFAGAKTVGTTKFLLQDFVVQPSIPAPGQAFESAQNGTEYLMTARNIFDNSTNVRVYAVTNTAAITSKPSALVAHYVDVKAETYTGSVPSTQPDVIGPYGKSVGATSAPQLDGGYNALGGGVKYANGQLYGALTSGSKDSKGLVRDVIAWFALKPAVTAKAVTATIASQGYVVPPTGYSVSYPSFALSKAGKGVIGVSITNPDKSVSGGYPSAAYISFTGKATSGAVKVTGQGTTSDDGFSGYQGAGPAAVGRWGDYAAGMVDPTNGAYYVANEFIPDTAKFPRGKYANWGTFITQIH